MALCFIFCFSELSYAQEDLNHSVWVYDKVSAIDIFGVHDSNAIAHLTEEFKKVAIKIDGKKLTVKNELLENGKVCSIKYVEIKKTPLSYYLSRNTVNMYKQLYENSGVSFPNDIYLLTSLYPGEECPSPYDEVLKVDNYLTVTKQNYVLFFKQQNENSGKNAGGVKNDNWSNYCHDDNAGQEFDGSSKALCSFPGMSIDAAYKKLKEIDKSGSRYLRSDLPAKNEMCEISTGMVGYKWSGNEMVSITVRMENEIFDYTFRKESTGTNLVILTDSQY